MKILGETIHFKKNLRFSFTRYPVWWIILFVTMLFDIFTTSIFIAKFGVEAEANASTRFLMVAVGPFWGNLIGKLLQLIAVTCFAGMHPRLGNIFLLVVILLNCWAVVVNSMAY